MDWMIAVTGAAGFIGSNLAHRLAGEGVEDLLLVDRDLPESKVIHLAGLASFRFLGHRAFLEALEAGRVKPEAIFHLGACSDTTMQDWDFLKRNNLEYTRSLWNWCAREGRPLIYASSAATYGDGSRGFSDETPPWDLQPLNLYGKSKNEFDAWALREAEAGRPRPPAWAGVKFFNVYGPRESHKGRMASVVFHAYNQVLATGKVRLFRSTRPDLPDGGQMRDFVYVEDCLDHMLWLWKRPGTQGLFNSGTGTARTFNDLAAAVFAALGREPVIEYFDMPPDLAGRYQNFTRAEMEKIRKAGFRGSPTSLEEGVRRYVEWMEAKRRARLGKRG